MAINKETHGVIQVVLKNEVIKLIKDDAETNHRTTSAQIAYMIEQQLKAK